MAEIDIDLLEKNVFNFVQSHILKSLKKSEIASWGIIRMYHAHPKIKVDNEYCCPATMIIEVYHPHYKGMIYIVYREDRDVYRIYAAEGKQMLQKYHYVYEFEIGPILNMMITGKINKKLQERLHLRKMAHDWAMNHANK